MKKLLAILAAAFVCLNASAKFGIIGGIGGNNAAEFHNNVIPFHAGVTYNILFPMGVGLQPSLMYVERMANFVGTDSDVKLSYIELPVQFELGINLFLRNFRLFVYGEPFVGVNIAQRTIGDAVPTGETYDRFEFGIGAGAGIQLLKHFQLTCGYEWNLNTHEFASAMTNKPRGFTISGAILF